MLVVTEASVWRFDSSDPDARPREVYSGGGPRRAVELSDGAIVVATDDGDVLLAGGSSERLIGRTRRLATGVPGRVECLLATRDTPAEVLIGTVGAHLYRVGEGGGSTGPTDGRLSTIDSFEQLDVRESWHTPWGGPPAVRSLASADGGLVLYADIHVGSIIRSTDGGQSWQPVGDAIHEDVHQVATTPAAPKRVYANTAAAVFISDDRGDSWRHAGAGEPLSKRYGRAIAVSPDDPDVMLATVSDGPHGGAGQMYRSEDAGQSWTHVADGFPAEVDHNIDTFHVAFSDGRTAWAALDRSLYVGTEAGTKWRRLWQANRPIRVIG